ncbi:Flp family type IVb pilin [Erythrobacter sp. LQ02-29]|uniref:Flp family type IVb pilin n=1 Tax=Erythrobacter sp. LQ02-29 TaxID=2920384 RepID=UPI001F4DFA5D|nr:Flp family type IVb pilin [Erythrobacter sp. LQ02-29]MCP9223472.1 Flp family type IVb pilin [Erythrobacter sp. LQ02-29]
MKFFNKLVRDEEGATAIEYGLIAALIAVAAIAAMNSLGGELSDTFNNVSGQLDTAQGSTGTGRESTNNPS